MSCLHNQRRVKERERAKAREGESGKKEVSEKKLHAQVATLARQVCVVNLNKFGLG